MWGSRTTTVIYIAYYHDDETMWRGGATKQRVSTQHLCNNESEHVRMYLYISPLFRTVNHLWSLQNNNKTVMYVCVHTSSEVSGCRFAMTAISNGCKSRSFNTCKATYIQLSRHFQHFTSISLVFQAPPVPVVVIIWVLLAPEAPV